MRLTIFTLILTIAATTSCIQKAGYRQCDGAVWNTTFHIKYNSPDDLSDSIHLIMRQVELSLSPFCDSSTISRINRNESMATDNMLRQVFTVSQEVSAKSEGAFDPTVAPLVNIWGFGYRNSNTEPTRQLIDSTLPLVGIRNCYLDGNTIIKKHPRTEFNFSAISKGFGCDLIGEMLKRNNCYDFMIEIGGEIVTAGMNQSGEKWKIMIDAPINNDSTVTHSRLAIINTGNCGIATSGNYRNYKSTDRGKIGHTISPITGYPVETSTLSVTVIAPTAMKADALATACMALPLDKAISLIENESETEALFVTIDRDSNKWKIITTNCFPAMR